MAKQSPWLWVGLILVVAVAMSGTLAGIGSGFWGWFNDLFEDGGITPIGEEAEGAEVNNGLSVTIYYKDGTSRVVTTEGMSIFGLYIFDGGSLVESIQIDVECTVMLEGGKVASWSILGSKFKVEIKHADGYSRLLKDTAFDTTSGTTWVHGTTKRLHSRTFDAFTDIEQQLIADGREGGEYRLHIYAGIDSITMNFESGVTETIDRTMSGHTLAYNMDWHFQYSNAGVGSVSLSINKATSP